MSRIEGWNTFDQAAITITDLDTVLTYDDLQLKLVLIL